MSKELSQLIIDFRAIQEKNSISPDSLGYILSLLESELQKMGQALDLSAIQSTSVEQVDGGIALKIVTGNGPIACLIPLATAEAAGLLGAADYEFISKLPGRIEAMVKNLTTINRDKAAKPIEVASEEAMEALVASGQAVDGQLYYVPEEE